MKRFFDRLTGRKKEEEAAAKVEAESRKKENARKEAKRIFNGLDLENARAGNIIGPLFVTKRLDTFDEVEFARTFDALLGKESNNQVKAFYFNQQTDEHIFETKECCLEFFVMSKDRSRKFISSEAYLKRLDEGKFLPSFGSW